MHLQQLVLLAVLSNTVAAGPLRREYRLSPRFVNSTAPAVQSTTAVTSLTAQRHEASATAAVSKQVGSVPAFGDGPGAATAESSSPLTTPKPSSHVPTISSKQPSQLEQTAGASGSASKQVGSVPAFGDGPGAATEESKPSSTTSSTSLSRLFSLMANNTAAAPTKPTALVSSVAQSPSKAPMQSSTPEKSSLPASAKTSAASAAPPPASQAPANPTANNGNIAMALGFNSVFGGMKASAPCDAKNPNEAVVCINGQYATCSNGKYTLTACSQGEQCFALPLPQGTRGVTVQCASMQAANQQLGQGSKASPSVKPTSTAASQPKGTGSNPKPVASNSPTTTTTTQSQATESKSTPVQSPKTTTTTTQAQPTVKPSVSSLSVSTTTTTKATAPTSSPAVPKISTTTTSSSITTSPSASLSKPAETAPTVLVSPTSSPVVPKISTTTTSSTITTSPSASPSKPAESTTTTSPSASPSKPTSAPNAPSPTTESTTTTSAPSKPTDSPETGPSPTADSPSPEASPTDDPIIISIPSPEPSSPPKKAVAFGEAASQPVITQAPSISSGVNGPVTVTD